MDLINSSEVFRKFYEIAGNVYNQEVQKWKNSGGVVMGYTCSFVPEELLIAAGFLPFRIRGNDKEIPDLANDYFEAANICSMVRSCFNQVLTGEYNFIDGAVIGGGCDANRHMLDNWVRCEIKTPFLDRIIFPHASGEEMAGFFRNQLTEVKTHIENHFGVQITDEKLNDAIKLCNEIRDLQKEIYSFRQAENPPISGSETVTVMVAGTSMPKEMYKNDLKTLIGELRGISVPEKKYKARLMIVGPGHDNTSMCDIVEDLDGFVVADLTCSGGKVVFGSVKENTSDPLQAIADYQVIDRPFCPKNLGAHPHISKEVFEKIRDFKVDGIIGQNFLCCDTWGGELYILSKELKEIGIPMLRIEREYISDSVGQLRTRVQAFIETITGDSL
jgi:benzoyl-CoA reductase/2-hydroxyglutaryl-CoA dehydratase subunit BcrC/BadD/HgdB